MFDLISAQLNAEEKREIFQDKAICLCFLRVALTSQEQQLLLKMVYQPEGCDPMEPKKFAKTHLQAQNEVKDLFKKLLGLNLLVEVV